MANAPAGRLPGTWRHEGGVGAPRQATVIPAHAGIHWVNAAHRAPNARRSKRLDTGPVSSTGWHFRRYDNGWRNHVTNQVRL